MGEGDAVTYSRRVARVGVVLSVVMGVLLVIAAAVGRLTEISSSRIKQGNSTEF